MIGLAVAMVAIGRVPAGFVDPPHGRLLLVRTYHNNRRSLYDLILVMKDQDGKSKKISLFDGAELAEEKMVERVVVAGETICVEHQWIGGWECQSFWLHQGELTEMEPWETPGVIEVRSEPVAFRGGFVCLADVVTVGLKGTEGICVDCLMTVRERWDVIAPKPKGLENLGLGSDGASLVYEFEGGRRVVGKEFPSRFKQRWVLDRRAS